MTKRFVLLDRDGTVIVDKHYLHDPDGVELLPGALAGLKKMQEMGFGLAILTNQSGIGRGMYTDADVHACNRRLMEMLAAEGVEIAAIYYCPHAPEEECNCRKPATGLMDQAAEDLGFDPAQAFMVGDKKADMGVGRATGAATILVRTGKGAEQEAKCAGLADFVADDLDGAAEIIRRQL